MKLRLEERGRDLSPDLVEHDAKGEHQHERYTDEQGRCYLEPGAEH